MVVLSNKELRYMKDPYSVQKAERGVLKQRIDRKKEMMNLMDLSIELQSLMNDEQKEFLIKELLDSIDKDGYRLNIIEDLNQDKNPLVKKLNYLQKRNQINKIIKNKKILPLTDEEKNVLVLDNKFNLNDLNSRKKTLSRLYKSEGFILYRKLNEDVQFIFENNPRKLIWKSILKSKKLNLKRLIKRFHDYSIKQFYERGILIPLNLSQKEFLKDCMNNKIIEKDNLRYLIQPYKFPSNPDFEVIINPYYSKSNINYNKSVGISMRIKDLNDPVISSKISSKSKENITKKV